MIVLYKWYSFLVAVGSLQRVPLATPEGRRTNCLLRVRISKPNTQTTVIATFTPPGLSTSQPRSELVSVADTAGSRPIKIRVTLGQAEPNRVSLSTGLVESGAV